MLDEEIKGTIFDDSQDGSLVYNETLVGIAESMPQNSAVIGETVTDGQNASLRGKALASRADLARLATEGSPAEKQALSEALGIDDWTALDVDSFNAKIVKFVENGGIERYKQLRELIKNADTLSEADARPMPSFMNMQKDGIRRYSDENSRIAVMKNGDTYRLYDYDLRTVSKELTRAEVNAALREYNAKKNAVTSMNQESMQVTENNSAIDPGSKRMALPENISAYSDEEINSIESRKENIVARSYNDVLEFFEYAVSDQSNEGKTMFIGKISNKTAAKIRKETGMNAFGKSIALNSHDIRHMMKEHGNAKTEAMRNQEAITTENFGHVIETIANPDKITASKDEKSGVTSLIFEKEIAGKTTAITIFSEKRKTLTLKTAWIIKKEQHISQPTNAEALIRTPEARSSMDAVPTDSISQETEKVNTSDEKNISKARAVEKSAAELDSIAKENIPEYSKLSVPTRVMIRKVLYDALAVGYSESDAIMFARVSARSGVHMMFSKKLCQAARIKGTKDFVYADGYYDPYGNRIVINPEGTRSVDALLIHELTHAIYKDKRGRIILERGAKNMSDKQKESIIKSYSHGHIALNAPKGSSTVIMEEMNAHYIEGQLKNKNLLEALLSDEPTLKDKILSFFKGASTDYAGNAELSGAAKRLFKRYKKLFDSFSAQNQDTNAYGAAVANSAANGERYALGDSDVDKNSVRQYNEKATERSDHNEQKDGQNTSVLERIAVSTSYRNQDNIWEHSKNTRTLKALMGYSDEYVRANNIKAGSTGWLESYQGANGVGKPADKQKARRFLQSFSGKLSRTKLKSTDTVGRNLPESVLKDFSDTVFKTEDGTILSLWHWTNEQFATFKYGDMGFHAGTFDASHAISFDKKKQGEASIFKELYFNSKNPLFIDRDLMKWTPHLIATYSGILNSSEIEILSSLDGYMIQQYDSDASIRTREMLKSKGYDSIIYTNDWEGGLSVIAFDNEQFYTVAENGIDIKQEAKRFALPEGVEIETVDDIIEGISQGGHEFNGYRAFINRDTGGIGATVTVKRPDGERIRQRIDNGRYLKDSELWEYAAAMVAKEKVLVSFEGNDISDALAKVKKSAEDALTDTLGTKTDEFNTLLDERAEVGRRLKELTFGSDRTKAAAERNFNDTKVDKKEVDELKNKIRELDAKIEKKGREVIAIEDRARVLPSFEAKIRKNIQRRNRLEGLIAAKARAMKDLKVGKFKNATQAETDTFNKSIMSLGRIDFRGNMNQGGTRKILGELKDWINLT